MSKDLLITSYEEKYPDLTATALKNFKNNYIKLGAKMLDLAVEAAKLSVENETEFISFCKEELNLSKSTVSKLITSGLIVNSNPELALPIEYSKVYELAPVRENMEDFYNYANEKLADKNKSLVSASQKEIRDLVKSYNEGDIDMEESEVEETEDEEVEDENETESEVEESEEESLYEKYGEVAENCINIILSYEDEELADCGVTLRAILQEVGVLPL